MHANTNDPMYSECANLIFEYDACNATWKRYYNGCSALYEQMSACMKLQRDLKRLQNNKAMKERNAKIEKTMEELELDWK